MTRAYLHLLLVFSLALAPLHHVLAMQAPAAPPCAEMSHHGGDMHSAAHGDMDSHHAGSHAHGDGLCNGCASCTHCVVALITFITIPMVAGAMQSPELRVAMRSVDSHPDLRPPRFS